MQPGVDRLVEPEDAAAEEDAQRGEQGPEEALAPVPERMGLIRGPGAAEHADEQEHLDRHLGGIDRGLGAQGYRPGHHGRHPEPERFSAIHREGNQHTAARCPALGCPGHPWYPFRPARSAPYCSKPIRLPPCRRFHGGLASCAKARYHSSGGTVAAIGTSSTVGACRSAAAAASDRSTSRVSARAAWQPYPRARETMSMPGMSSPGTPGESSTSANALRI